MTLLTRQFWSRTSLVASVLVSAACGAEPIHPATAHRASTHQDPIDAEPETRPVFAAIPGTWNRVTAEVPTGWHAEVIPLGATRSVGGSLEGERFIASGGFRARVQTGTTSWAHDRFANQIDGAVQVEHGWIFLTSDRMVWQAESFLGEPRPVGSVPVPRRIEGVGGAAITTYHGEVWVVDEGRLRRASLPPDVRAVAAAFANPDQILVVLADNKLLLSDNGGLVFADVAGTSEAPTREGRILNTTSIAVEVQHFVVTLPSGERRRVGHRGVRPDASHPEGITGAFHRELTENLMATSPTMHLAHRGQGPDLDQRDGTLFSQDDRGEWSIHTPGHARSVVSGLPGDCSLVSSAYVALFLCFPPRGQSQLFAVDPSGQARLLGRAPAHADDRLLLSDDGRHLIAEGPCTEAQARRAVPPNHLGYCISDTQTGRAQYIVADVGEDPAYLYGSHGSMLLFDSYLLGNFVHIVRGNQTHRVPDPPGIAGAHPRDLQTVFGGYFSATALLSSYGDPPDVRGVLGDFQGNLQVLDLPNGAMAVGFMDANRGVAAGNHLGQIWVTDDSGTTWTAVRVALEGAPDAVPLMGLDWYRCEAAMESDDGSRNRLMHVESTEDCQNPHFKEDWIRCNRHGCMLDDRVWVGDASFSRQDSHRVFAANQRATVED